MSIPIELFDRKAEFVFGKRGETGVKVSQNRISFDIRRDTSSFANRSKIKIYNLNPTNRFLLAKKNIFVKLNVGYGKENELKNIFVGDITKSSISKQQGPDIITIVDASEGGKVFEQAKVDISFRAKKNYSEIVEKLVNIFVDTGLVVKGAIDDVIQDIKKKNIQTQTGLTLTGRIKDVLKNVLEKVGKKFFILGEEIKIVDIANDSADDSIDNQGKAILLTPDSGLLERPSFRDDGTVEFKSLLNPEIMPGSRIKISTEDIDGVVYKVNTVKYLGDTRANNWFVIGEGSQISFADFNDFPFTDLSVASV